MKMTCYCILWVILLMGCSSVGENDELTVPEGKVEIRPELGGNLGIFPEDGRVYFSRGEGDATQDIFKGKTPQPLADGSTLWLYVKQESGQGSDTEPEEYIKSYVVHDLGNAGGSREKRQALYPCKIEYDDEGNIKNVEETNVPLYLTAGQTYTFRAMSPAKKLIKTNDGQNAVNVKNKEYLMANDDRYASTDFTRIEIKKESHVEYVRLKPLAHQTAQLEFTICKAEEDRDIFSLDVLPQGVEVSGVQSYYRIENEENGWNWCWTKEPPVYLQAKLGDSDERFTIRRSSRYEDSFIANVSATELYIKCPILPTDAYSGSIIVLFNLSVNGVPTQYEMVLNQKIFKSAYTYHYEGKLKMEDGITTITWQYVSWNEELPIL